MQQQARPAKRLFRSNYPANVLAMYPLATYALAQLIVAKLPGLNKLMNRGPNSYSACPCQYIPIDIFWLIFK